MQKKIFLSIFIIFSLSWAVSAQQTHEVQSGETLYSVSKKYGVTISNLVKANPNANRGLRNGMSIVIPIIHESIDTVAYFIHKVRPLESFFSISNKFGVNEEQLLKFNPELSDGFRSGMRIKVPQFEELDATEAVETEESDKDVEKSRRKKNAKFNKKESYKIALMMPLYLDKNDTIEAYNNLKEGDQIYKKTRFALDFYSGAKIAIDTMRKAGMSLDVHVFDTNNDANHTFDLVAQKEFDDMDLVIGPFYSKNFKLAAEILSRRDVPIVAPLSTKPNLLEKIPNAFQVITTPKRQVTYLSDFIAEHYSDKNITLVRRDNDEESKFADWMMSAMDTSELFSFQEVLVEGAIIDSIHHHLDSLAETNVLLIPSQDKSFVTDMLTKLNVMRDSNMVVFGMPDWYGYKDLDYNYLDHLNVHIPNSGILSYEDSLTQYFVKEYQESTGIDPNQRFAFSGFDITYYFLSLLYENGGLSTDMYMEPNTLLNMSFDYNYNRNEKNGSRNQFVQIITYDDLEIKRVD